MEKGKYNILNFKLYYIIQGKIMFNLDKRTISIIVIIMIGIAVLQYVSNPSQLISLLVSAPGVLIAITFHEFAHGYAAYKLGDDTAKNQGSL